MRSFPRRKNNSGAPRQRSTKPFHALNKPVFALILLLACGFRWNEASACSTCGCTSSGTDFGMLQTWGQHSLGLQYRLDRFDNGVTEEGLSSSDFLSSCNINGIWSPAQRLQIQAQVPLRMQTRITGNDRITRTGLGDSWLLARYAIWQNASDSTDAEPGFRWLEGLSCQRVPSGRKKAMKGCRSIVNWVPVAWISWLNCALRSVLPVWPSWVKPFTVTT